jgi:hypothetical protein
MIVKVNEEGCYLSAGEQEFDPSLLVAQESDKESTVWR